MIVNNIHTLWTNHNLSTVSLSLTKENKCYQSSNKHYNHTHKWFGCAQTANKLFTEVVANLLMADGQPAVLQFIANIS
jgi:hypothetical protein